ncbi:MAG: mechanosensitive ion channel family protein [Anaerolineales bacterium]
MPIIQSIVLPLGLKLLGAVAAWIIGSWLISFMVDYLGKAQLARKTDPTLVKYFEGGLKVGLRILLVVAIFGILGIETTSFAALLAAAGVAIGMAWSGLLANFAAGVFLVFLRPFKVGDTITAGGVSGAVKEIGLFVSTIDTGDNVRVFVGNNAIFADKIQNFSANPYRRVELSAQFAHDADLNDAMQRLRAKVEAIPNVMKTPAPDIEILTFSEYGTVLAVRPYCHNDNYWQVYFDTNKAIAAVGSEGGYSVPEQRVAVRNVQ